MLTIVVAIIVAATKERPIEGAEQSSILLVVLAGALGAVTSHLVSGAVRAGLVGGLVLGVLGYLVAVFAVSLGIVIDDTTLFFVCVSLGGVTGGLIPTALQRWRQTSAQRRTVILLVGSVLLVPCTIRWWTFREQARLVAEWEAAGATVSYADVNPFPTLMDKQRMHSLSEWFRELMGLRVIQGVTLGYNCDPPSAWTTNALLPHVTDLSLHASYVDDDAFALLNSGTLSKLDSLRFGGREFDDASLARLDPLPGLVVLDVEFTSVTDNSIEHLTSFPQLQILSVQQTNVTAEGVKRLKSKIGQVLP